MLIIVADRGGLGGAAIRHALETGLKKWGVKILGVVEWKKLVEYLDQDDDVIVLSTHTLRGFSSPAHLASEVKRLKSGVGFFVYNGGQMELSADIDGYLPSSTNGVSMESIIVPFFKDVVRKWSYRPIQPRLF